MLFLGDALSLCMRCGFTSLIQRANIRVWNGNIKNHQSGRSKKTQPSAGKVILALFGMHRGQFWNTAQRGVQE
jgi:hypothetical protein